LHFLLKCFPDQLGHGLTSLGRHDPQPLQERFWRDDRRSMRHDKMLATDTAL
jgi:hypothetical protein